MRQSLSTEHVVGGMPPVQFHCVPPMLSGPQPQPQLISPRLQPVAAGVGRQAKMD